MILFKNTGNWRQVDLADALGLSQTEISFALDRCKTAGFIDSAKKKFMKAALLELLALVDAIRVGRAREKVIAVQELEARLGQAGRCLNA